MPCFVKTRVAAVLSVSPRVVLRSSRSRRGVELRIPTSNRSHAWKHELQQLADVTGLTIEVSHFPPGTSMWNKIEHRLFCHIRANWRGTPLTTYETIVDRHRRTSGRRLGSRVRPAAFPEDPKMTDSRVVVFVVIMAAVLGGPVAVYLAAVSAGAWAHYAVGEGAATVVAIVTAAAVTGAVVLATALVLTHARADRDP